MTFQIRSLGRSKDAKIILLLLGVVGIIGFTSTQKETLFDTSLEDNSTAGLKIVVVGGDGMQDVARRKASLDGQGCTFPKLETFGAEMMPFIEKPEPLKCLETATEEDWVSIDKEGKMRKREDRKDAICHITYFDRDTDYTNKDEKEILLKEGEKMTSDFAKVKCSFQKKNWNGLLVSVAKKENVVKKAKENAKGQKSGVDRLSLVMFGFDSMSQQHFRRKMPSTIQQLESMGAVVLNGYNIVGDGTPQAFIPILTGKTELELPNTRKRFPEAQYVDEAYPFAWSNFSDAGYVTLYGEDAFNIGTFTYRLKGFKNSPTDHYTRPYFKEVEAARKERFLKCIGSEPFHKSWFRYGHEFLREYKEVDRFLLMHQGVLSHDDINLVEVQDEDFAQSLESMDNEGLLDDAVLIVMADHGHRFTKIRDTHQGQLEERLPMFSVRLPPKFRSTDIGKRMQENLEINKDRLTTPFDVHATLMDILKLPQDVGTEQDKGKRSLSMLRPIPADRNCGQAGVEAHWCTCLNWQNATTTEADRIQTKIIAEGLVSAMDSQLSKVRDLCARMKFKKIISAEKLIPNESLLKYDNVKDKDGFVPSFKGKTKTSFAHYKLKIETSPNGAIFEATMFYDGRKNELEVDLTSLSHVNRYGDDPHCIISKQFSLAHFCVCHDRVRSN